MMGVIGITTFLAMLGVLLVVTRLATKALVLTGLSQEAAEFQARSAFTGTGFTTSEAEVVVNHPVRRRVIMILMMARSAGLVTIFISLVLSFAGSAPEGEQLRQLLTMVAGIALLWLLARSKAVDVFLTRVMGWAVARWTGIEPRDYESLLNLGAGYMVMEKPLDRNDWLSGRALQELNLNEEGVLVLALSRQDGSFVGAPRGSTRLRSGDTLILYGRKEGLQELCSRGRGVQGEEAHRQAVHEQRQRLTEQDQQEEVSERRHEERRKTGKRKNDG